MSSGFTGTSNINSGNVNAFTRNANSYADVTGATFSLTTKGGPVLLFIAGGSVKIEDDSGSVQETQTTIKAVRGATDLVGIPLRVSAAPVTNELMVMVPGGAFLWVDTPPAGTYTYKLQAKVGNAGFGGTVTISGDFTGIELMSPPGN